MIDVEAAIVDFLIAAAVDVPVSTRRPKPRPAEWIRIERAGGPISNQIERAVILVEAYAANGSRAVAILNTARTALLTASTPTLFAGSEIAGPINLPDPLVPEQVRYTATVAVRARAALTA
jgi:hypothetical protein